MNESLRKPHRVSRLMAAFRIAIGGFFIVAAFGKFYTGVSTEGTIWSDVAYSYPLLSTGLIIVELIVGVGLISGISPMSFGWGSLLLLSAFMGFQARELTRAEPRPCGCSGEMISVSDPRVQLGISLLRNAIFSFGCAALIVHAKARSNVASLKDAARSPSARTSSSASGLACSLRRGGWSIVEMVICVGIVAVLLGIILPVTQVLREHARGTKCASNLSQIYGALSMYAAESRGFVPRHGAYATDPPPNHPIWIVVVANKLSTARAWNWPDLPAMEFLRCPSHPLKDIPSGYMMNNFSFDSQPYWTGSPPVLLGKVRNSSTVPWLLDAADRIGPSRHPAYDGLYFETEYTLLVPGHVWRVGWRRHRKQANILFFDGHVSGQRMADLSVERFDDGIRNRW